MTPENEWTFAEVAERAKETFACYEEQEPGSGVRNGVASILSDLGKFPQGEAALRDLDKGKLVRMSAESDDTAFQELLQVLKQIH